MPIHNEKASRKLLAVNGGLKYDYKNTDSVVRLFSQKRKIEKIVFLHNKKHEKEKNLGIDFFLYLLYTNIMYQNGYLCLDL